jgi:hypothetical protein
MASTLTPSAVNMGFTEQSKLGQVLKQGQAIQRMKTLIHYQMKAVKMVMVMVMMTNGLSCNTR